MKEGETGMPGARKSDSLPMQNRSQTGRCLEPARPHLLCLGPLPGWAIEELSAMAHLTVLEHPSRDRVFCHLDPALTGIISRSSARIDAEVLARVPGLTVVSRSGVGFDNIDVAEATSRGIPVVYAPGALTRAVAEHTLAFMLLASKNLFQWRERVRAGRWEDRDRFLNADLCGSTVGIVGFGRIGTEVWRLLQPFGVQCLANDPYVDRKPWAGKAVEFVALEELLPRSDFVTLHVPLSKETRGLIGTSNLNLLKPGAVLLNTARGAVVECHQVLAQALDSGRLSFVGIDTPIQEPPADDDPLLHHPRALITAHVASRTPKAQAQVLRLMIRETLAILEGKSPDPGNVVNPEVLTR